MVGGRVKERAQVKRNDGRKQKQIFKTRKEERLVIGFASWEIRCPWVHTTGREREGETVYGRGVTRMIGRAKRMLRSVVLCDEVDISPLVG